MLAHSTGAPPSAPRPTLGAADPRGHRARGYDGARRDQSPLTCGLPPAARVGYNRLPRAGGASAYDQAIRAKRSGHCSRTRKDATTSTNRIGLGHDTHRLVPGSPLRLGGVDIPHDARLLGHSDADVLLHAITDALLGAIAAGDIGELFPDTSPANLGKDSAEMLGAAWHLVRKAGYRLQNLDCIVFAERPKLGPFKQVIRARIAKLLEATPDQIGLQAKTGEKVGPIGREEAISAECVVLLSRDPPS